MRVFLRVSVMHLIEAEAISYQRHGHYILRACDICVATQEIVAIIGENGVGKTTLLQLLAGSRLPDAGKVVYGDGVRERMAMLPDKAPLYPDWTVFEALSRLRAWYQADHARMNELIGLCALEGVLNQRCAALSHGYRQRVAMAQALLGDPKVLLLDEPSNGLDVAQRLAMRRLLKQVAQSSAIVLISHDWVEVAALAHRVYVLHDGGCVALDLPERQAAACWLGFSDVAAAQQVRNARVRDGRFVGVDAGDQLCYEGLVSLTQDYPALALQEKIDALA